VLGEVHLASPTVNRAAASANEVADAPSISSGNTYSIAGGLGSGLPAGNAKQPAAPEAPLPVGGDVKTASPISQVPPVYPAIAKNQHISGDVRVDALIDANGRVTTMKIISGPTLLHQAAMDALRQWKYRPATLDGKPVAMHLTVTLQFRLQ
jgi:protein TonB